MGWFSDTIGRGIGRGIDPFGFTDRNKRTGNERFTPSDNTDPRYWYHENAFKGKLPSWMGKWGPGARFSTGPVSEYREGLQPIIDRFRGEMGTNLYGTLMERSRGQIETGGREAERMQKQSLGRAGYGGQGASPFDAFQTQLRMLAQSGQLGLAAQQAELSARDYQNQAGAMLERLLQSRMQAELMPVQIAQGHQVPVGGGVPPWMAFAQGFMGG